MNQETCQIPESDGQAIRVQQKRHRGESDDRVNSGEAMLAASITVFKEEKQIFIDPINPVNLHHPSFDTDVLSQ
jgi:hypothetical protein